MQAQQAEYFWKEDFWGGREEHHYVSPKGKVLASIIKYSTLGNLYYCGDDAYVSVEAAKKAVEALRGPVG